jgi:dsRNA-specific ribonuclease
MNTITNTTQPTYADADIIVEKNVNGTETYVFDPYNPLNALISQADVQNILNKYGIRTEINNFNLYKRAFVHRSYTRRPQLEDSNFDNIVEATKPDNCLPLFTKSNERLEFVGDGVLECITKYYLYRRFPKENEGFMTEKKIALVKNESIGKMAMEMGLHKWFILSKHAELKQTRTNLKKLGCLFESFIGAIFLDFNKISVNDEEGWFRNVFATGPGFQMVQVFVENVFEKHVDWINLIRNDDNYKNILQVKIQKEFKVTPHYIELSNNNDGYHMGVFLCLNFPVHQLGGPNMQQVSINEFHSYQEIHEYMSVNNRICMFMGEGKHKIKKKAEQISCEEAIRKLDGF